MEGVLVTIDVDGKMTPVRKKHILLHSLGPQGLKIYNQIPKVHLGVVMRVFLPMLF